MKTQALVEEVCAKQSEGVYKYFKTQHPDNKVGFSKFTELRTVLAGATGTHSVCHANDGTVGGQLEALQTFGIHVEQGASFELQMRSHFEIGNKLLLSSHLTILVGEVFNYPFCVAQRLKPMAPMPCPIKMYMY